jgi:phosphate transport system permease protein
MMSRHFTDLLSRRVVFILALASFLILFLIALFILKEGLPAFRIVGLLNFLFGMEWRPLAEPPKFGILTMIVGSLVVTALSLLFAIPLGIGCAVLLSEVAPRRVQEIIRPAVELLVGIPSVVYGLVGMTLVVPAVRHLGGTGPCVLAAGLVLMAMVLPTIISISEDSIRAVPQRYKEGSLALGATQWQTIWHVILPAARSGIFAAIILSMGRAIGETMAMIMVIGNAAIIPTSPLSKARTLTGNIAVEIMGASGTHESALFATGVVLFILIMLLNSIAFLLLKRGKEYS